MSRTSTGLDTELILLEIEILFERFRNLSQESRVIILAKLKVKLLEEFKDLITEESDPCQETTIEFSYGTAVEDDADKDVNIIELPIEFTDDVGTYCDSTTINNPVHDFFPTIESVHTLESESEQVIVNVAEELSQQNDTFSVSEHNEEPAKEAEKKTCFICNYCGKQYEKKATFKTHLKRHENSRDYECANCSSRFKMKEDLIKHLKTHSSEKNFKCPICPKRFVNNAWLKNHINVIHEKKDKLFCERCDYFAFSNHTLKEHVRLKHDKIFKKFACLVCKYVCSARCELKEHMRSHTGETPYKCKLCDAAFIRSGRLNNHMKGVHGENKFPCEVCEKSFKTSDKLKRHFLIHTKIKPFSCPFCRNYASNTQGNLNKHVKVVHQMTDFSYLKHKKKMLGHVEDVQEEWFQNAEPFTKKYLENLSNQNPSLTVDQLKQQYHQMKKKKTTTEKNIDSL